MTGLPRSSFFFGMSPSSHAGLHGLGGPMKDSPVLKISTRFVVSNSSRFLGILLFQPLVLKLLAKRFEILSSS
jgi:hypothetical protein